ncbi:vesicle coat component [Ascosphaera acerosa]|nr:vesicle coat component [Ascosphaera acerosa]
MSSPVFNYQSGAVISSGSKYDESTNEDDLSDFPETVVLEASVPATPLAHSSQQAPSEPFPDLCDPHTEVDAHSQVAQDETHTVLDSQLVHSEGAQRDNTRLEADGEVTNHDVQSDDSPSQTHVERNSSHGKEADTGALDTEDDPARSVDDFRPAPPTHLNTAQFFKRDDILSRTDSFPLSLGDTAQDVKSHEVDPPQTLKPTLSDTAGTQQPVPDRAHDDGVSFFDQLGSSEEQLLQDSVSSDAPDDESAAKSGIMNAATGAETAMPQDAAIREMVVASEQGSDPTAPSQEANATEPVQIRCDHDDGMPDHHSAQPQPLQQPTEAESRFDEGVPLLGSQQPVQRRSNTTMSALKRHDRTISAIFRADGPAEEEETFLKAVLEVQNTAKHSGDTDEAPPPLRRKSTSEVLESISARDRRASRMMDTIAEDPASDTADTPDGTMAAPEVTEEELAQRWRVMGFDDDDDEMLREDAIPEAVEGVSVTAALMPSASTLPEPSSYVPTPPADIGYNDYFGRIASQPITHYSNGAVHSPYMSPPVQALPAHTPHEYQYAPHQPSTADLVQQCLQLRVRNLLGSQEGSASTEPQQPADALCDQYVPTQNHAAESHTSSSGPMVRLAPANTATDHQTALGKSQSPEIDMPYHPVLNASHSLTETPELARVSPIEASHLPTSAPSRPPETAQSSSPVPSATLVQHVQGLNDVTTPVNLASGHDESMPNNASSGYDPPGEPYEPSPQAALGCASPNGEASGYQPLSGTGAEQRPLQSAQGTASSNGRSSAYNAVTTGYQPLSQSAQGYTPPSYEQPMPDSVVHSVQGYAPPSYEPPSFGYEPPSDDTPAAEEHADSDDEARKPKQRSMMDDDDDDDFQKRAEALKREERARHDREAAERVRKAAEEDAKRAAAKQSQKKGWFSGWFGSKKENEPGVTVHRAKLGEKNNFYYDKELGRWVNKKDPSGAQPAVSAVPPPPRAPGAGPPRGPPQAAAVAASTYQSRGPPMSAPAPFARPPVRPGLTIPPSAAGPPVSATASQVQAGPSPYAARPPTSAVSSPVGGAPPSAGPKPAALAGANSIDDLLGATPAPRVHGGRSKKKGRGYVDVMAN